MASASVGGAIVQTGLHLLDDVKVGDYVLIHTGFAIQKVSEEDALETIRIIAPEDGARLSRDHPNWEVVFQRGGFSRVTLFVTAPGADTKQTVELDRTPSEANRISIPLHPKLEVAAHYKEEIYWWLVAEDEANRMRACSALHTFTIE